MTRWELCGFSRTATFKTPLRGVESRGLNGTTLKDTGTRCPQRLRRRITPSMLAINALFAVFAMDLVVVVGPIAKAAWMRHAIEHDTRDGGLGAA